MKRLFFIDLLWLAVVVLAGLTWSAYDQAEYADRLANNGLSENAVIFHTKAAMTPAQAVVKLTEAKLNNLQVQFQQTDQHVYFYGHGDYATLPVTSGQWFTDADLRSSLPVAVIGRAQTKSLYEGSNQRYWRQDNRYIPVIGIVATRLDSPLNAGEFLNASAATTAPTIHHLTVIADGQNIKAQTGKLKQVLKAASTSQYHYGKGDRQTNWWTQHLPTIAAGIALGLVTLGLSWLLGRMAPMRQVGGMDPTLGGRFLRGLWAKAALHATVVAVIGVIIATSAFYLTDYSRLLIFVAALWAVNVSGTYYGLRARYHREGSR
ncbi:hypothetical protein ACFQ5J_10500 [Lacticaseibacillus baoqingensis]|uniref:MacB-like periplasmic core domain-containing protein n=1 Tax=Lacticaseibacillus baoqingensis TaxID=2486013 RepID=A0ABW4E700_9LACO|nr:hypothetical protein [Lacticaseibacillus baoqingensis]